VELFRLNKKCDRRTELANTLRALQCGEAETKVSVPLRYHQPTSHDNSFHRLRWSNTPSNNNCHLPRMSTSTVTPSCGSQKKLPSIQRRQTSFMQNLQIKPRHMQALHYVFLSLSFCQVSFCSTTSSKYSLDTSVTPWRLCMKQDNWLIWKGHLKSKVDLKFDS